MLFLFATIATGTIIPGLTQGSVLFGGPAGALAQDNAHFFWDDTADQLGLGTNTPGADLDVAQAAHIGATEPIQQWTGGAHTALPAGVEYNDELHKLNRTVQWLAGALATQRFVRYRRPTISFLGAGSTATNVATLALEGAPQAGAGATLTNPYTLWSESGLNRFEGAIKGGSAPGGNGPALWSDANTGTNAGRIYVDDNVGAFMGYGANFNVVASTTQVLLTGAGASINVSTNAIANIAGNTISNTGKSFSWTETASTSGTITGWLYTGAAHTTLQASVEAPDIDWAFNRTVQFGTGALPTQRAIIARAPTYSAVAASIITTAATLAVEGPPTAGPNVTITNRESFWVQSGTTLLEGSSQGVGQDEVGQILNVRSTTAQGADIGATVRLSGQTGSGAFPTFSFASLNGRKENATAGNFAGYLQFATSQGGGSVTEVARYSSGGNATYTQIASTSGLPFVGKWTSAANTGVTASTEAPAWEFNSTATQTWATGALATQRFTRFRQPTIAFAAASTVTNTATVAIEGPPQAGTNATLTNSYSLWVVSGRARFDGLWSLGAANTQGTVGAAGAATALPLFPTGYFKWDLDGVTVVTPYYAAA